jgi:GAF domain-containing protein
VREREERRWAGRLRLYRVAEAAAAAVGYAVATLQQGVPASAAKWLLVGGGGAAIAVPLWLKSRREAQAEQLAVQARATLRLVIVDTITPIADLVGRVHLAADEAERAGLRGQLAQMVVDAGAHLCDGDRARATFFALDDAVMRPAAWAGRADSPHTVFTRGSDDRRGQEAHLLVEHHDYLVIDDLDAESLPPGVTPRPSAGYKSFVSVAVFSGERNLGMLTVDAPEPYAFEDTDLEVLRALAQLLGAGLGAGLAGTGSGAHYERATP